MEKLTALSAASEKVTELPAYCLSECKEQKKAVSLQFQTNNSEQMGQNKFHSPGIWIIIMVYMLSVKVRVVRGPRLIQQKELFE